MAKLKSDKLYIINFIDIEDYLRSVGPSESYASWPLDTLKAQAVAARTYAFYQARHREDWSYDLVDDAGDQAYKGINREHPKTNKAVKATVGKILTYDDKPILAMYSANSGGHTADAGSIFSLAKPYLVAHPDHPAPRPEFA
ncbi:MAG: SpoIID/LytB domain-containing protein [Deltaproteobacteria bacterium]|nr:SpoIID/LytB domain-containing protein [Deltaproteobacteria bacterium]